MPLRIVVVDDDQNTLSVLRRLLHAEGFEVEVRDHPAAALALIETTPFDILLTDLVMADMSGLELVAAARGLRPGLRCCVMSGHATHALAEDLRWLKKPLDFDELLDALETS